MLDQEIPLFNYRLYMDVRDIRKVELMVNVIRFSTGVSWATEGPVPAKEHQWESLPTGGLTDVGAAFTLLAERFKGLPEPKRALFPVVIWVLDGHATDDYKDALEHFLHLPGVEKNVLTAVVALGNNVDETLLKCFDGVVFKIKGTGKISDELEIFWFA